MSILSKKVKGTNKTLGQMIWIQRRLWILAIPFIVYVFIFDYVPMAGITLSFIKYIPGKRFIDCEFVGLRYFRMLFTSPGFYRVMRNTLGYNIAGMLLHTPLAITLAILLSVP